jgi:hypothetical protein
MMRSVLQEVFGGRDTTLAGIMADGCCKSKHPAAQMVTVLRFLEGSNTPLGFKHLARRLHTVLSGATARVASLAATAVIGISWPQNSSARQISALREGERS